MKEKFSKERLSEMLKDMDVSLFNLQLKMAGLVTALLSGSDSEASEIDLPIPVMMNGEMHVIRCARIYIDPADETIKIKAADREEPLAWDDIDISAQYQFAQQLYTRHLSDSLYRALSSRPAQC